jgi:lysozyme family protein
MAASLNFNRHLHNGDPLTARTVQVPAGRPKTGEPPFTWEESATDALMLEKLDQWEDWSVPGTLYKLEQYNGWGYRLAHPDVKSPYGKPGEKTSEALKKVTGHYLIGDPREV